MGYRNAAYSNNFDMALIVLNYFENNNKTHVHHSIVI